MSNVEKIQPMAPMSTGMPGAERMPALAMESMDAAQRAAAQELIDGPRGAVFGPFIPLLRSPDLMSRLQKVGEYIRFHSALETRINEFVMLIVSRLWTQQFEWRMHYPLALKAGVAEEVLVALGEGRRPLGMRDDEQIAYDLCEELARTHGVSDFTYQQAVAQFGERGVIDMLGLVGYFSTVSMIMNVARTPPMSSSDLPPLAAYPA
jgi:4-carboxymuconolactone decarboxylase